MPTVRADLDACQGYANCVMAADDVFDIDDDGVVVLLRGEVEETERSRVTDAANSCPANALWLED